MTRRAVWCSGRRAASTSTWRWPRHVFVRRADGRVETLVTAEVPFGTTPGEGYADSSLVFEPGDALVAYSDGFFNAFASILHVPRDDLTMIVLYCKP